MTNFEQILYEALSNLDLTHFLNMPKVSVDPDSDVLEKLTVPMLRSRLARAGKAKGTTALKKKDLIKILRGEEVVRKHKKVSKAASPKRSSPKLGLLIDSPARSSPAKSPKRGSLAKSPARSSPKAASIKRSSLAKSPARSSPKAHLSNVVL